MPEVQGLTITNEFYSSHYFSVIFPHKLDATIREWNKEVAQKGTGVNATQLIDEIRKLAPAYREFLQKFKQTERKQAQRWALQRDWYCELLSKFGYRCSPGTLSIDGVEVPLFHKEVDENGYDRFLILAAYDTDASDEDPLSLRPHKVQFEPGPVVAEDLLDWSWQSVLDEHIFSQVHPPRWVLQLSYSQMVLIDRTKWPMQQYLRFDLSEIFDRLDRFGLAAMVLMLHPKGIGLRQGTSGFLDGLEQDSHRHAYSVSTDLKYAMREAIECIGNEAIWFLQREGKLGQQDDRLATKLSRESLRYLYRLLFLLYLEARPNLGYVPMNSETFVSGYSLESLRELEMVQLTTERSRNGYFLHESINQLFRLVREGLQPSTEHQEDLHVDAESFQIRPVDDKLFARKSLPILKEVKFRNFTLQRVIRLLSLTRPDSKAHKKRGRISYSHLGINQLGSVYETLLPYRGSFAKEDLYEVCRKNTTPDILDVAHLVNADDLEDYDAAERVYEDKKKTILRKYSKGQFVYRLAGRERTSSGSFYTPESLTQCVVKYSLKERIGEDMTAAEILKLTVCEPAMGSAAFINEAVNQLAEAYLVRRQRERKLKIERKDYVDELQKVKRYITDRNVFGVDLNPVAIELGELSMRLNCMYRDGQSPWFGFQVYCGNSLVGALREFFQTTDLARKNWYNKTSFRINSCSSRALGLAKDRIYHFLVPHPDMLSHAADKKLKQFLEPSIVQLFAQRKNQFKNSYSGHELNQLQRISSILDVLWQRQTEQLAQSRQGTQNHMEVWGTEVKGNKQTEYSDKDRYLERFNPKKKNHPITEYQILKLVMDYWCAMWYWPAQADALPPTRAEYIQDLMTVVSFRSKDDLELQFDDLFLSKKAKELAQKLRALKAQQGYVSFNDLLTEIPRLKMAHELAEKYRYFHWELEFADIFLSKTNDGKIRGGFDLVIGNPPWIRLEFKEQDVLAEFEPKIWVRKMSASHVSALRPSLFQKHPQARDELIERGTDMLCYQQFLSSNQNYPFLKDQKNNLYKAFIGQSWWFSKKQGVSGLLHPKGVFDSVKGDSFRQEAYPRLRYHFRFHNALKLFPEVNSSRQFAVNIYSKPKEELGFDLISNLYLPKTVDGSYLHSGSGDIPGIKDKKNQHDSSAHKARVIKIDKLILKDFAAFVNRAGQELHKVPILELHSTELLSVIKTFAQIPNRLGNLSEDVHVYGHWNETKAQRDDTIRRQTQFVSEPTKFIYSGPHFFVGNPFAKTPRAVCLAKAHYDTLDLSMIPDNYLPRTNYVPAAIDYNTRTPNTPWTDDDEIPLKTTQFYRVLFRRMIHPASERTLISSLVPKAVASIGTCTTVVFRSCKAAVEFAALCNSIVLDYFTKCSGVNDVIKSTLDQLPVLGSETNLQLRSALIVRALILSCLSSHFRELWETLCQLKVDMTRTKTFNSVHRVPLFELFQIDAWTVIDVQIDAEFFFQLTPHWQRNVALRSERMRRQALVEIDVLVAMAFGFTLDELLAMYRIQFPLLQKYENDTWYDAKGCIVYTSRLGYGAVPSKATKTDTNWSVYTNVRTENNIAIGWEDIKELEEGLVTQQVIDNTLPGEPVERTIEYRAPFSKCDREQDYRQAWDVFSDRFSSERSEVMIDVCRATAVNDHSL